MPRKPILNMGCEASNGWFADSAGKPTVVLCRKPGKIRDDIKVLKYSTILCDECYEAIKAKREAKADDSQQG